MSFSLYTVVAEHSSNESAGSSPSCCRIRMLLQSTDDWALGLHSCRALSSQPYAQANPSRPTSQLKQNRPQPEPQKCNPCAREKMLPLHRNIHMPKPPLVAHLLFFSGAAGALNRYAGGGL